MKIIILSLNFLSIFLPGFVAKAYAKLFQSPKRSDTGLSTFNEQEKYKLEYNDGIAFHCWNPNAEKIILLMHGWEGNSSNFSLFISNLVQEKFRIISIDGPGHGLSKGKRANPFIFANAIVRASKIYGQPYALIGHSMGAGAAAFAVSQKMILPEKLLLVASPSDLKGVLFRFSKMVGMSASLFSAFLKEMKKQTGSDAEDINPRKLGQLLKNVDGLILHCRNDKEIPFEESVELNKHWKTSKLVQIDNLGHRRILKDGSVSKLVSDFIKNN